MNKKIKKLKLNEIYSNFKLISRKKYEEIDSFVNIFEHQELGTELFFIENEDKKRAFEISFRTPSVNSKGVQHILEHSVFRGSRKYDFGNEETFALLIKNSMVSFLNAGTYPDKTVYPFSTNLESEFMKVMDVYMDAVLFPNILKNKNFFKQEG
jgi:Zn-dependent M16 (insulinase) family peptidase